MRVTLSRTMGNRDVGDTLDVTETEARWLLARGYTRDRVVIARATDVDTDATEDAGKGNTKDTGKSTATRTTSKR
jgi:hypothetical protein